MLPKFRPKTPILISLEAISLKKLFLRLPILCFSNMSSSPQVQQLLLVYYFIHFQLQKWFIESKSNTKVSLCCFGENRSALIGKDLKVRSNLFKHSDVLKALKNLQKSKSTKRNLMKSESTPVLTEFEEWLRIIDVCKKYL